MIFHNQIIYSTGQVNWWTSVFDTAHMRKSRNVWMCDPCCFNRHSVAKWFAAERWLQYPMFIVEVSTSRHLCWLRTLSDSFPIFRLLSFGHNLATIVAMKDHQAVFPHLLLLSGTCGMFWLSQLSDGPFHTATHYQGAVGHQRIVTPNVPSGKKFPRSSQDVSGVFSVNHLWKSSAMDANGCFQGGISSSFPVTFNRSIISPISSSM